MGMTAKNLYGDSLVGGPLPRRESLGKQVLCYLTPQFGLHGNSWGSPSCLRTGLRGEQGAGVGLGKGQPISMVRAGEMHVGSLSGQLEGGWSLWLLVRVGSVKQEL